MDRSRNVRGVVVLLLAATAPAQAQRAGENAVAEASDAFGTAVGREEIGLYTSTSARGFSPVQAGNLRIDGLYFDTVTRGELETRIMRGSTVHVGISAQGFPFPAPTGVVNFHLRTPGDSTSGGAVLGVASFEQAYAELDFQTPLVRDTLSVGGGVGYARNGSHFIADVSHEWTVGAIAQWRPTAALTVTPFWTLKDVQEHGEKPYVFIGDSGYPDYRGVDLMPQPWTDFGLSSHIFGTTARLRIGEDSELAFGGFHADSQTDFNHEPFLFDVDAEGRGTYWIAASPARFNRSTSGEIRYSRRLSGQAIRHTFHASLKGRQRSGESGGAQEILIGPGTTRAVPIVDRLEFATGASTLVEAKQYTPGLAYEAAWRDRGQVSLGIQKSYYDRTFTAPARAPVSSSSSPWLYNVGAAANVTNKMVVYASATRGFEEIGNAPLNAANRDEAVPAQLTEQIDVGVKYQLLPRLQLVAGLFEIEKPYFDLDVADIYRQVGTTSNRGAEISLAGDVVERFTVVAGVILIDPKVELDESSGTPGSTTAIGPVPGLVRANFQYRIARIPGLTLDAELEHTSRRYARAESIRLPSVTTLDAGVRYNTKMFGRAATLRLQTFNLTNEYGLTPSASGQLTAFESRRFDLSLSMDL